MEIKKLLENKRFIAKDSKRTIVSFQDYAIRICNYYNIKGSYRNALFKLAKTKRYWLEGKIGLMREMERNEPLKYNQLKSSDKLANYLFSLFRKKK